MFSWPKWRRTAESVLVLLALVVGPLTSIPVFAQVADGSLSGAITSASGSRIPNAVLSLKNTVSGYITSAKSKEDGSYVFRNLLPGTYELSVSAVGFAVARTIMTIKPASSKAVTLLIQRGSAASPNVDGVVNSKRVSELPLNGRSASDVAALEPGVATARTQTSGQAQRGFGTQMTISGARPRQNDSRLDGISVNDYANGPPGSALGVNLGVDAVEQFSVLTSNYPAQHGRSSGGIISASTRSGTNRFHGDLYEFFRNSALDARNYFDIQKPPFRRNQFGASLGGPIWKDKTFVFGDYEGLRQS